MRKEIKPLQGLEILSWFCRPHKLLNSLKMFLNKAKTVSMSEELGFEEKLGKLSFLATRKPKGQGRMWWLCI